DGIRDFHVTGVQTCALPILFLSPLASVVPGYATAPALLYVACLMLRELVDVNWDDITEAVPAAIAAIAMPLTYSIANGLAFGFRSEERRVGTAGTYRWATRH